MKTDHSEANCSHPHHGSVPHACVKTEIVKHMPGPWRVRKASLSFSRGVYGPTSWVADTDVGNKDDWTSDDAQCEVLRGNYAAEQQQVSAEERSERNRILNEEHNEYWSRHCVAHGTELTENGSCAICEAELVDERRIDL